MNTLLESIREIIHEAEHMKNAYFWNPPAHASERRAYEKKHSHKEISWTENGNEFTAEYTVTCSCHNVYACGIYTKNGSRTTLTAIRNSYNRLRAAS